MPLPLAALEICNPLTVYNGMLKENALNAYHEQLTLMGNVNLLVTYVNHGIHQMDHALNVMVVIIYLKEIVLLINQEDQDHQETKTHFAFNRMLMENVLNALGGQF